MNSLSANLLAIASVVAVVAFTAPARSEDRAAPAETSASVSSGLHDFDFQFGEWRVHHRVRTSPERPWVEFDGTSTARPIMDGAANVEDNKFDKASGTTRGVALRAYDDKTRLWAIWWIDSRVPHGALDPPVTGRFESGVGTFYSDGELNGKPMRTRFVWSQITPTSAHWEQAYSFDAGNTWDVNWIMEFRRVPSQ